MGGSELRGLQQLRDENRRLTRAVADLTLDKHILQEVKSTSLKPRRRRELANQTSEWFDLSARRTGLLFGISRSTCYYQCHARHQEALKMRLKELRWPASGSAICN